MSIFKKYKDFRSTINIRLFSVYLAIVLIIPAISTVIEYLVSVYPALRSSLQVDLQNFHMYQLFTSSFVHLDFDHFLANVTAYLLIAIYGLVLATIVNRKRLYLVLSKIIVVIFLIFGAFFAFFNATTTYYAGLSGIDSALAGLLLIFWLIYLEHMSGRRMRSYYGLVLACVLALSAGIIARYMLLYHTERSVPFVIALATVSLHGGARGRSVPAPVRGFIPGYAGILLVCPARSPSRLSPSLRTLSGTSSRSGWQIQRGP